MRRILIAGKWWSVCYVAEVPRARGQSKSQTNLGLCERNERVIYLRASLNERQKLKVLTHELIHAAIPNASEKQVRDAEEAVWKAMRRGA